MATARTSRARPARPFSTLTLLLLSWSALTTVDAAPLHAQQPDSLATLTGTVVSAMTGGPLETARVVLKKSGRGAFTQSDGSFTIADVPAGMDTVEVSLIGFATEQVPLNLKGGRTTRVTLLLSETVLKVEEITVEVERPEDRRLEGFRDRERTGMGHYLSPEEIEEANPTNPSDLLRMIPGVQVGAYRNGRASVRMSRARLGCDPVIWLDGIAQRDLHIDDLNRDDFMAIEVYNGPSETPPRFTFRGASCGTIVIWTHGSDTR